MGTAPKLISKNEFKIEKGVPVARLRSNVEVARKYPFPEMAVGDSIFVPGQTTSGLVANASHQYAQKHGLRFRARAVEGGVRIWRVA